MAQLTKLKHLEIAAPILVSWDADCSDENELRIFADALPLELETLTVMSSGKGTWDFVANTFRRGWFSPQLTRLRLEFLTDYRYVIIPQDGVCLNLLYLEEGTSKLGIDFKTEVTFKEDSL